MSKEYNDRYHKPLRPECEEALHQRLDFSKKTPTLEEVDKKETNT